MFRFSLLSFGFSAQEEYGSMILDNQSQQKKVTSSNRRVLLFDISDYDNPGHALYCICLGIRDR